jgi:hypothetical protein
MRAVGEWSCGAGMMCVTDAVVKSRETEFVNTVRAERICACEPLIRGCRGRESRCRSRLMRVTAGKCALPTSSANCRLPQN